MRFISNNQRKGKSKGKKYETKISENLKIHTLEDKLTCNGIKWYRHIIQTNEENLKESEHEGDQDEDGNNRLGADTQKEGRN
jgi:hypothetical protein